MEMQNLPGYAIAFLCGTIALYTLQKLTGYIDQGKRKGHPATLDPKVIQQMVDEYRNNHLAAINKALGVSDAYSVSFGLKTLKKFIADIEFYSKKVNPRITDNTLGIRFYYAAYPKDTDWGSFENEKSIGKDYAQKHTLIMIPTLKKNSNSGSYLDYDFNPLDRTTFLIKDRDQERPITLMAMSADRSDNQSHQVMAQNHGQLIPPAQIIQESY